MTSRQEAVSTATIQMIKYSRGRPSDSTYMLVVWPTLNMYVQHGQPHSLWVFKVI